MNKDLDHYIYKTKLLSKKECKKTVEELENAKFHTHYWFSPRGGITSDNGEQEPETSMELVDSHEIIMKKLHPKILEYMHHIDLPWYDAWNGYTNLKWNKYTSNTKMKVHCDHIHGFHGKGDTGVPILTCLGLLNDDFTGGEVIMFDNKKIDLKPGEVIIHPSNFLFPHEIKTVKKGKRYSFVSWVY
jgi:predicted 2-oxoglutarate/Fe(II)-dependent dioxygenase YbiX